MPVAVIVSCTGKQCVGCDIGIQCETDLTQFIDIQLYLCIRTALHKRLVRIRMDVDRGFKPDGDTAVLALFRAPGGRRLNIHWCRQK